MQADLLNALVATGKPVVAVLIHGRPVTFVKWNLLPRLGAVLAAWRPGCEGGSAIWDLLTGAVAPSGRLAQSWVRRVGQVKSQASPWYSALQGDFDQVGYNGDLMSSGGDGELSSWQPQWPFGFGLSYTAFAVAPLGVGVQGSAVVASCNVTNVGAAAAKQVVGLYYSRPVSSFVRNHRYLLAFGKTAVLAPGESATLALSAPLAALASYDPRQGASVVEKGVYTVTFQTDSVTIQGNAVNITV